ncbi:MAG: YdeI/OmpD-associated family protein [Acidimicrobiia bacterium]
MEGQQFDAVVTTDERQRVMVPLPFDPDRVWGPKNEHRVHGTVNGMGVRAVVESLGDGHGILLGPAWRRQCGIEPGDEVDVALAPEGPQRVDLAPDFAAALEAEPDAGAFFDSLAQFYRNAYLRWIDSTKRSPELRAARIVETVELLKAGVKQGS